MSRLVRLASMLTRPKPAVGSTPADVIHHENKWRLLHYRPRAGGPAFQTPVLLVPSLINRHYVMDLLPGKSMAEDLVKAGHDVYCIDWGTPGDEDRYLTFDDVCDRYLGRAIRKVAARAPRGKTHVLGYCLGGTLATIHTAAHPEHVASLLLLAAPVRFTEEEGLLEAWTKSSTFRVGDIVEAYGNVPWQLMQSAFHMLRPTLGLAKVVGVADRAGHDELRAQTWNDFIEGFVALETWGNDNVSFPGACYERYIEELYRGDALMRGTFTLSGRPARLESITCPTMAVVFEHDNIVPWKNAAVIEERIASNDKLVVKLPGGHVGAVVSRSAQKKLWPAMSAWWAARDRDVPLGGPKAPLVRSAHEPPPLPSPSAGGAFALRANAGDLRGASASANGHINGVKKKSAAKKKAAAKTTSKRAAR